MDQKNRYAYNYQRNVERCEAQIALIDHEIHEISQLTYTQLNKEIIDNDTGISRIAIIRALRKERDKWQRKLNKLHWQESQRFRSRMGSIYIDSMKTAEEAKDKFEENVDLQIKYAS